MAYQTEDRSHPLHFDVAHQSIVEDVIIDSGHINLGYEPKVYRVSQAGVVNIAATTTTLIPVNTLLTKTILKSGSAYLQPTPSINANTLRLTGAKEFKGRMQFIAAITTAAWTAAAPPETYMVNFNFFDDFGTSTVSKTLPILKYNGTGFQCVETFEVNFPYNAARTYCGFSVLVTNEQAASVLSVQFYSLEVIQDQ